MASQDFKFIQKIFSVTRSGQKLTLKPLCIAFILIFWWLVGIVQPAFLHHFAKAYKDVKSLFFFYGGLRLFTERCEHEVLFGISMHFQSVYALASNTLYKL